MIFYARSQKHAGISNLQRCNEQHDLLDYLKRMLYCCTTFVLLSKFRILWATDTLDSFTLPHSSMILESAWVGTGHGDAAGANLGNAVLRFAVFARSTDASSTIPWALMHTLKTFENCFSLSTPFVWRVECPNWLSSQETYHWNPFSTMDWEFLSHMKPRSLIDHMITIHIYIYI